MPEFVSGIFGFLAANAVWTAASGALILVFAYVMKRIPNEKIKNGGGDFLENFGKKVSKWGNGNKWTKPFWKLFEDYILDFFDNTLVHWSYRLTKGLRYDNNTEEKTNANK